MAAQRASNNSATAGSMEDLEGFAVAVTREECHWKCKALTSAALTNLRTAETELRELRSSGAVFGLLNVDNEFFIIVLPAPVLAVIVAETDLYADEQLDKIAQRLGFADELSAVLDKLPQ